MGTIVQRSLSDGTLRYRAEIRVNRKDYPAFRESKTFTKKRIAEKWVKKREVEIETKAWKCLREALIAVQSA